MNKESQGCMYCGKWLKVASDFSGYVYCSVCGKDGKKIKREYKERETNMKTYNYTKLYKYFHILYKQEMSL